MIKSPATTQIERGAYSAIVYKEGDWIRAEDNKGTVISENTGASVVLQAALDAISSAGGGKLVQQEGTYAWAAAVTYSASNLEWIGSGPVINDCSGIAGTAGALRIEGAITGTNSALTAEGTKGQKDVTVADASSFSAGDWIRIRSETIFNSGSQHLGELQKIANVAGNVITCEDVLAFTYTVADTATVDLLTVYENITLKNMHFIGNYGVSNWTGFLFRELFNVLLDNIEWIDAYSYCIIFKDIVDFEARSCLCQDADQAGLGYGICVANASRDILIHHCKFYNCRHGVTCGGDNTYGIQTNQVYDSNTFRYSTQHMAAFGPHNTYDGLIISNNTVMNDGLTVIGSLNTSIIGNNVYNDSCGNGAIGILDRGNYTRITGNLITTLNQDGIRFEQDASAIISNVIISGNTIRALAGNYCAIRGRYGSYSDMLISGNYLFSDADTGLYLNDVGICSKIQIKNNDIRCPGGIGIYFDGAAALEYISIMGNTVHGGASSTAVLVLGFSGANAKYVRVHNNTIIGGTYGTRVRNAEYVSIHDNEYIGTSVGVLLETLYPIDYYSIRNNHFINCTTAIDDFVKGTRSVYEQHSDLFMDILAAAANAVHAAIVGTGAEQEITTAITNPDVPRNISITSSANSTGDVVITGVDAKGNSVTDTITIVTGGIAYGVVAFASVSKITIPSTVANPDTITVGISDKLGLSNIIYASGDVYKVKVNNADDPAIGTVNTTYHTVDCAAINAADDITIWYRSNLNIIS